VKGCNGSSTDNRSAALNVNSTIHIGPSRLDGSYALFNSRTVESMELRLTAKTGLNEFRSIPDNGTVRGASQARLHQTTCSIKASRGTAGVRRAAAC